MVRFALNLSIYSSSGFGERETCFLITSKARILLFLKYFNRIWKNFVVFTVSDAPLRTNDNIQCHMKKLFHRQREQAVP